MSLLTMGAVMGGNVRVGLEDSLYLGKGQMARSSAEQVRKIKRILEEHLWKWPVPPKLARCSD